MDFHFGPMLDHVRLMSSHMQEPIEEKENKRRESGFVSTATLIDILQVEQLSSSLTTASSCSAGREGGGGDGKGNR